MYCFVFILLLNYTFETSKLFHGSTTFLVSPSSELCIVGVTTKQKNYICEFGDSVWVC